MEGSSRLLRCFATASCDAAHGRKATIVALSRSQLSEAPADLPRTRIVPNPIEVRDSPYEADKDDYLLWLGRMHEDKGPTARSTPRASPASGCCSQGRS